MCLGTAKALARLRGYAGSPEPSLVAYVISTIISWAGSNMEVTFVCIGPGAIALYLIPYLPHSEDSDLKILFRFLYKLSCYGPLTAPKLVSHLSAHVVNRLLCENRKSIPISFNGKKLFKNVTLQILNFILISWIIELFPIWCNVNFVSAFIALNNTKKQRKFNIHHTWKILSVNLLG